MSILGWLTGGNDDAAAAANQGLLEGQRAIQHNYGAGRTALQNNYRAALDPMRDVYRQGRAGSALYYGALGVGGADEQRRAYERFINTPGYVAGHNSGTQAIDRGAASRGMLGSGNTMIDLMKFSQDYGSQKFDDYLRQLSPALNQQMQGATGMAGIRTGLGNNLNQNYMGQGNAIAGIRTGIGQNNAGAIMANNNGMNGLLGLGLGLGTKLLGVV